jgi:hypothetical protein
MNGPHHYEEAENLLGFMRDARPEQRAEIIAAAQVHATLAGVAAQVDTAGAIGQLLDGDKWQQVTSS